MHATNDLRSDFEQAVDLAVRWRRGDPEPIVSGQPLSEICGKLWNCTDTMPRSLCDQIADMQLQGGALAPGASYAQGARAIRSILA